MLTPGEDFQFGALRVAEQTGSLPLDLDLGAWSVARIDNELRAQREARMAPAARVNAWIDLLYGTPFEFESGLPRARGVRVHLRSLDCITLVYHVLSLAGAESFEDYIRRLYRLRYVPTTEVDGATSGEPAGFVDFACEALLRHAIEQGVLIDVTDRLDVETERVDMSLKALKRPRLNDPEERVVHPRYPDWRIDTTIVARSRIADIATDSLHDGDVALFTRGACDTDGTPRATFVCHAGFVRKYGDVVGLVHSTKSYYVSRDAQPYATLPGAPGRYLPGVVLAGEYLGDDTIVVHGGITYHGYDLDRPRSIHSYAQNFSGLKILRPI
jgi:hypothetical protein